MEQQRQVPQLELPPVLQEFLDAWEVVHSCYAVHGVHELCQVFEAALAIRPLVRCDISLTKKDLPSVVCLPD